MAFKKLQPKSPFPDTTQEALAALDHAYSVNPESSFYLSCSSQFNDKGYLTPLQISYLNDIIPNDYRDDDFIQDDKDNKPYVNAWADRMRLGEDDNPFDPDRD
jgi:hypothetical protein